MTSLQCLEGAALVLLMGVAIGIVAVKILTDVGALINNSQAQQVTSQGLIAISLIFQ